MARVVYDQEMMGIISLLGRLTRARIKDCFKEEDTIYCIVEKGEIGKAIGKGGVNIKRIGQIVKKKVRMIEFGDTPAEFVKNLIFPTRVEEIREEDGVVEIVGGDKRTKGLLIGRGGENLTFLNKVVKRFFEVEVKVV
ncbi:NusA-like transcription termination signal-binding factor [Candidatus Woesearchaeota archaeon]|nr:NusA-like transcription termination signal-binding factor [Candidatus Woesearchaeota archaeon]